MTLFELIAGPDDDSILRSQDPDDVKIGELVKREQEDFESAEFVILGYPEDEGVRRNNGRVGSRRAPSAIRQALYRLSAPGEPALVKLCDLGNLRTASTLEATHDLQAEAVSLILKSGKRAIVLGGGNDVSYPDCLGLSSISKSILAFNVDRHFDVRADQPRNSGTPYRQLLEEKIIEPSSFYEMGSQPFANSGKYRDYLLDCGANVHTLDKLREQGIELLFRSVLGQSNEEVIFWGLDLDVVRSSDAPGVSAPCPTGLTAEEICEVARIAGSDSRSKILELSEVNPDYDIDLRTASLAALLVYYFLMSATKINGFQAIR